MLLLTVVSIALVSTGVISGSSLLFYRPRAVKGAPRSPPLRFVVQGLLGQTVTVSAAFTNKTVCEFQRSNSHRIVNNLYRAFGSVALATSDKEVAILYSNTVGNGGYIEFWSHDFQHKSILESFLSRWQRRGNEQGDHLRIYISSKLVAGTCELDVHESSKKYLWYAQHGTLYKVEGTSKRLAARIEQLNSRKTPPQTPTLSQPPEETQSQSSLAKHRTPNLLVYEEVINPYLAVCTMLFFMLQPRHR